MSALVWYVIAAVIKIKMGVALEELPFFTCFLVLQHTNHTKHRCLLLGLDGITIQPARCLRVGELLDSSAGRGVD